VRWMEIDVGEYEGLFPLIFLSSSPHLSFSYRTLRLARSLAMLLRRYGSRSSR
jgi:hypothetical protein